MMQWCTMASILRTTTQAFVLELLMLFRELGNYTEELVFWLLDIPWEELWHPFVHLTLKLAQSDCLNDQYTSMLWISSHPVFDGPNLIFFYLIHTDVLGVSSHLMLVMMMAAYGILLVNYGANITQLITFGQPRVGNSVFASYFSEHVPATFRITNEHDMVPHLPPYYTYFPQKTYHHFPREVWLYTLGVGSLVYRIEQVCDSSGEDPSCSRSVSGNSISDHLNYLGVELQAETWGSCKIVTDSSIIKKVGIGSSNFVLTRDSSSLTLKNSHADNGSLSSPQYLTSHSKV
ncbi:uncharacterized protein LOC116255031 isoform X3 [Nymphaea colorata]|uniref:uncharacterized protein LOC116255031 isoform X3 n=1 Tax=Nymphaea colorata TaxID=210225 RepID=UPI00129E0FAA|nr:uncharacterized protein LOC116255031 isoform X3 [Nymphaea colorata]XP_031486598.1 uncharacterized protein LOC116255031 isoform X3 [Nymphaea colorata]